MNPILSLHLHLPLILRLLFHWTVMICLVGSAGSGPWLVVPVNPMPKVRAAVKVKFALGKIYCAMALTLITWRMARKPRSLVIILKDPDF